MKAIETRYYGPGNVRGARIVASDSDGNRVFISYPDEARGGVEGAHRVAAEALCKKMHWTGALAAGSTRKGYVFVFVDRSELEEAWLKEREARERTELQQARVEFRAALAAQEYFDNASHLSVELTARDGVNQHDVDALKGLYPDEWQAVVYALREACQHKVRAWAEADALRVRELRCIVCAQRVTKTRDGGYVDATGGDGCYDGVHQVEPGALTAEQHEEAHQMEQAELTDHVCQCPRFVPDKGVVTCATCGGLRHD